MIEWLDFPLLTLSGVLAIRRAWLLAVVASLLVGWLARQKRHSGLLWFGVAVGGFMAGSEIVRAVIPNAGQEFARGEQPGAGYTLWSDAAFRADVGLLLLVLVLAFGLSTAVRRLLVYADGPARSTGSRISAAASALCLLLPVLLWIWTAAWLMLTAEYSKLAVPLAVFVAVAALTAVAATVLEAWQRKTVLLAIAVGVVLAQLRYNATRPPGSMFESNGSVPFFLALTPVFVGAYLAQIIHRTVPSRRTVLLGWQLGLLAWMLSAVGWAVKFMGFYNYQNSYAFSLGSLLETPIRALVALDKLYYNAFPREIVESRNLAGMNDWEGALTLLAGLAVWLGVLVHVQGRLRVLPTAHTLGQYLGRVRHIQLTLQERRYLLAFVLITPAVALRTFTTFYPFLQTLVLSLQKYNPAFPPRQYIDFRNFERLSTDLVVRESLEFTILFVFVSTFFQMFLGLAIAHLLNANFRLRGLARTISLIPWAVPMVVAAIGFRWMFDDQFGMIPDLLRQVGIHEKWLIDPVNARIAVISVNVWKSTPFCALLLLAGLQGISLDLYEAAKVDGANWFDSLRFITVPMLLPIIVTVTMFMLVWQLAVFDLPFAMTGGAPGFATTVVAQKIYLEINSLNYSFAAAISVMLVVIVTVIGGIGVYTLRRVEVSA